MTRNTLQMTERSPESSPDREPGLQQLDLDIAPDVQHNELTTVKKATARPGTPPRPHVFMDVLPVFKFSSGLAAAVFFLLVVATFQFDKPDASIPENFLAEDPTPALPVRRNLPSGEFEIDGESLQLGLFRHLEGAEAWQRELTKLGLSPHIEKRVPDNGVLYAVVLGPLTGDRYREVLAILEDNEVNYFHKRSSGS